MAATHSETRLQPEIISPNKPFLILPREIRDEIYALHLISKSPVQIPKPNSTSSTPNLLALLRTNTQIYIEASLVLYKHNRFHVRESFTEATLTSTIFKFLSSMRPDTAGLVSHLTLDWTSDISSTAFQTALKKILVLKKTRILEGRENEDSPPCWTAAAAQTHVPSLTKEDIWKPFPVVQGLGTGISSSLKYIQLFSNVQVLELRFPGRDFLRGVGFDGKLLQEVGREEYVSRHWEQVYNSLKRMRQVRRLVVGDTMELEKAAGLAEEMGGVVEVEVQWGWRDWEGRENRKKELELKGWRLGIWDGKVLDVSEWRGVAWNGWKPRWGVKTLRIWAAPGLWFESGQHSQWVGPGQFAESTWTCSLLQDPDLIYVV